MSSIIGVFYKNAARVSKDELGSMLADSTTKYYNQKAYFVKNNIGLSQLHRYNTPESKYINLPFTTTNNQFTIVADARIDNRNELAKHLNIEIQVLKKLSDAHLIVEAFIKWKKDCVKHLIGDFAFAIYDDLKQELFIAKDPMGIKRLYYYDSPHLFAFASSPLSLIALKNVPTELDLLTTYRHFSSPVLIKGQRTYFKNIYSLLPGYALMVNQHHFVKKQYWKWEEELKPISFNTENEYIEAARELFAKAVNDRLRTNKMVGSELSGGLDSSGIVGYTMSAACENQVFHTFSNIKKNTTNPYFLTEQKHIQSILNHYPSINPHFTDEEDYTNIIEDMLTVQRIIGFPTYTALVTFGLPVLKKMEHLGINVMLSGIGGDECVSYRSNQDIYDLIGHQNWKELYYIIKFPQQKSRKNRIKTIGSYLLSKYLPKHMKQLLKRNLSSKINSINSNYDNIFNPSFLKKIQAEESKDIYNYSKHPMLQKIMRLSYSSIFSDFQHLADYHGLEYRFPMLDIRLINLFAQLPISLRIQKGVQRYLFRKTITPWVTPLVRDRKDKTGHTAPGTQELIQKSKVIQANKRKNVNYTRLDFLLNDKKSANQMDKVSFNNLLFFNDFYTQNRW